MSYIYCITNHVNGKKYIGKTTSSVSKRWKEHCRDYKKERCKDRPLYRAMNKYGIDSFSIEMLEECSSKESSERETYWINEFKTYEQYNEDMLVQVFDSVADAAHWCVDNGYAKTYNGGVRSHISNAAKHKTKTAYGYRWEYAQ